MKRTKIICTIGPAADSAAALLKLAKAGMNVARLNFSHNTHKYHLGVIRRIRAIEKKTKNPIAIIQDLQGPRIRLGKFDGKLKLANGSKIVLTTGKAERGTIPVTYANMHQDIKLAERVLIADGAVELVVQKIVGNKIYCLVKIGGEIISHKGINLPDTQIKLSALTAKDKEDLVFGVANKVDFVALSFVQSAKDIVEVRNLINKVERQQKIIVGQPIKVIAKIERRVAVEKIDEIIEAADAIMIARGDLGIEMSTEEVPIIQKNIIEKCLAAAKPVIVATQMLESMINNPRPTRAEASDVANAVIDHADAVMLSGETANGKYPIMAAAEMAKIICVTEASTYDDLDIRKRLQQVALAGKALSGLARILAENVKAKMLIVIGSESLMYRVTSFRPELPVVFICENERQRRQYSVVWGAAAVIAKNVASAINNLKKNRIIKNKDKIVVVSADNIYVKVA
ncbi:pyruvate kinase [Candidatus Falkowbacteria bacterium]|nr:pyruvate kinase [Candidatus Falkowbacteria bacterium]